MDTVSRNWIHRGRAGLAALALGVAGVAVPGPVHGAPFTRENVLHDLQAEYPGISLVEDTLPDGVSAREDVRYTSAEALPLALDLYTPAGPGPFPAVLFVHGGGWETGSRQMERPFAKQLAARGYVGIPVSYTLGPPGRFPAALKDLQTAVRWVRSHAAELRVDPAHIGAIGGSAGGQLVALLGASNGTPIDGGDGGTSMPTQAENTLQAIVDIDGVADFAGAALIAQEEKTPNATSRFLGGNYTKRRRTWQAASAITYVNPASAPCLFIDSTVTHPILPGRDEMSARLRALGIDSRVLVVPNTPHPFWLLHPWFETVLDASDAFLRRHLKSPGTGPSLPQAEPASPASPTPTPTSR